RPCFTPKYQTPGRYFLPSLSAQSSRAIKHGRSSISGIGPRVTPVTSPDSPAVTAQAAPVLACTAVTPVTSISDVTPVDCRSSASGPSEATQAGLSSPDASPGAAV